MAERSNAAVLKTVDLRGSGGSNPSLSAEETLQNSNPKYFAVFFFTLVSQFVSQKKAHSFPRQCNTSSPLAHFLVHHFTKMEAIPIDYYNKRRCHSSIGHVPPAKLFLDNASKAA